MAIPNQGIIVAKQAQRPDRLAPRTQLSRPSTALGVSIPSAKTDIVGLRRSSIKSLMTQIGFMESGNNLAYNIGPRFGRYATHIKTLINYGYITENGEAWTNKEGIGSLSTFLRNQAVQDSVMQRYLLEQYQALLDAGVFEVDIPGDIICGYLAVSHQFQDHISTYRTSFTIPEEIYITANVSRVSNVAFINTFPVAHSYGTGRTVTVDTNLGKSNLANVLLTSINGVKTVGNVINLFEFDYTDQHEGNANIAITVDTGTVTSLAQYPVSSIGSANESLSDVAPTGLRTELVQGLPVQVSGAGTFNGIYEIHTMTDTVNNSTFRLGKAITSNIATGTVSRLRNTDLSYIVARTNTLITELANTLAYLGSPDTAFQHYVDSGISDIASDFTLTSTTPLPERKLLSTVEQLTTESLKTTRIVQNALFANVEGLDKLRAIGSAGANIDILSNRVSSVYTSVIATKVKEWKIQGDAIVDSQGRPGSLFFNAGRYAFTTLAAGVITE